MQKDHSAIRMNRIKKKIEDNEELKDQFKTILSQMMEVIIIDEQIVELRRQIDGHRDRIDVAVQKNKAIDGIMNRSKKIQKLAARRGALKAHITMGLKKI